MAWAWGSHFDVVTPTCISTRCPDVPGRLTQYNLLLSLPETTADTVECMTWGEVMPSIEAGEIRNINISGLTGLAARGARDLLETLEDRRHYRILDSVNVRIRHLSMHQLTQVNAWPMVCTEAVQKLSFGYLYGVTLGELLEFLTTSPIIFVEELEFLLLSTEDPAQFAEQYRLAFTNKYRQIELEVTDREEETTEERLVTVRLRNPRNVFRNDDALELESDEDWGLPAVDDAEPMAEDANDDWGFPAEDDEPLNVPDELIYQRSSQQG
jgi:hypothetical protein